MVFICKCSQIVSLCHCLWLRLALFPFCLQMILNTNSANVKKISDMGIGVKIDTKVLTLQEEFKCSAEDLYEVFTDPQVKLKFCKKKKEYMLNCFHCCQKQGFIRFEYYLFAKFCYCICKYSWFKYVLLFLVLFLFYVQDKILKYEICHHRPLTLVLIMLSPLDF